MGKLARTNKRPLKIAIIGSRGIPGNYGGFETFAERLGLGLVERGHLVNVYCPAASSTTDERVYKGIKRTIVPNIPLKSLDKLSGSALSCIHASFSGCDIILFLGVAPSIFAWVPRLLGKKLLINIDGLEWKRKKWGRFASRYLKFSEFLGSIFCHRIIADSMVLKEYVLNEYGKEAEYIAYGADPGAVEGKDVLDKYGLKKNKYFLQVCRLEPENNSDLVIREYGLVNAELPLVIVGDAPYSDSYKNKLKEMADKRVMFVGAVYGRDYDALRSNAFCYIHAHEVGGTNPSLLEALAAGNCVAALDVPYNLEVIDNAGLLFSRETGSLAGILRHLLAEPATMMELRQKAVERIESYYSWDKIINAYEQLFINLKQ
ncbi:MAG: DUF1972 domain-containing protein [Syntrophorhabdaceae bacterium]|nr:DUF1972 domain-containing protein [Syntrophorhabdaceae bacterium]